MGLSFNVWITFKFWSKLVIVESFWSIWKLIILIKLLSFRFIFCSKSPIYFCKQTAKNVKKIILHRAQLLTLVSLLLFDRQFNTFFRNVLIANILSPEGFKKSKGVFNYKKNKFTHFTFSYQVSTLSKCGYMISSSA